MRWRFQFFISKKEFQKPELLRLMVKNHIQDSRLLELVLNDEENTDLMIEDLGSGQNFELYPISWINALIGKHALPKNFDYSHLMKIFSELNFNSQE